MSELTLCGIENATLDFLIGLSIEDKYAYFHKLIETYYPKSLNNEKEYDELSTIEKDKIKRDPEFKETLLEIESGKAARNNNYSKYILERENKETITANNVKYYTDELVRKLLDPEEIHREGKRDYE